jgi:hypothetical protein
MKKRIFFPFGLVLLFVTIWSLDSCTSSNNPQGTLNENVQGTIKRKAVDQNKHAQV